jgi:hypothetical protein
MTAFTLARMRHLDLLALWHQLHPDAHQRDTLRVARMTKDQLAAILAAESPA